MSAIRKKMIEDMQLRGLAVGTQAAYVGHMSRLATHYGVSPEKLNEEQVRQYILFIQNKKKLAASTCHVIIAALQFFYRYTVPQKWELFDYLHLKKEDKLPMVLSREEVKRILRCVRSEEHRVCLTTIYSCGLRISEGHGLQVNQIDSAYNRLHIRQSKGKKDRYVPLADVTLGLLRRYWATHHHPVWLFPGQPEKGQKLSEAVNPIPRETISRTFKMALKESGVQKKATVHTLRHSWATHMVEGGAHLHVIKDALGHRFLSSTAIYLHLTQEATAVAHQVVNELMANWS